MPANEDAETRASEVPAVTRRGHAYQRVDASPARSGSARRRGGISVLQPEPLPHQGSGPLRLSAGGTAVTALRASPDAVAVLAGYANGDIVAVDTRSWNHTPVLHAENGIRNLVFSSDGDRVASADAGDIVHLGFRKTGTWSNAEIEWKRLRAPARAMVFTPDGLLVVACAGGVVWVYSSSVEKWLYLPLGTVDLTHIAVSAGGTYAVVFDDEGRGISIDLRAVRRTINI